MAVLTYLAKNANRVVSHDELLSKVWPDAVVTPNTLQRSIAQLRKALGGDGQYHSYIKTHAKQGYSLECAVSWQDEIDTTVTTDTKNSVADTVLETVFVDLKFCTFIHPTKSTKHILRTTNEISPIIVRKKYKFRIFRLDIPS